MASAPKPNAALAKLARDREAIAARAAALDVEEKAIRKSLSQAGAATLSLTFGKLDLGEVSKPEALRLARAVQRLGLSDALARLESKS